jgi:hypothetical protein
MFNTTSSSLSLPGWDVNLDSDTNLEDSVTPESLVLSLSSFTVNFAWLRQCHTVLHLSKLDIIVLYNPYLPSPSWVGK